MAWLKLLSALLEIAVWLVRTIERAKLKAEGRAEIAKEQREAADAAKADYDAIHSDGRTFDDAVDGLSRRAAQRKPPDHGDRS